MIQPTFNDKGKLVCQDCGDVAPVFQRSTDEKFVCFACLPDEDIDRYPGWRQRMQVRQKRAAQARMNFGAQ
jgi:hypothetical protein